MTAFIEVDDRLIMAALRELHQLTGNLQPALVSIGDVLVESTKQRFADQQDPQGLDWVDISDFTKEAKRERGNPEIILTDYGTLGDTINYQLIDSSTLEVGSPMSYAAMMQFGGTKEEFPYLWGDIIARPFLGLSNQDRIDILAVLTRHINQAIDG